MIWFHFHMLRPKHCLVSVGIRRTYCTRFSHVRPFGNVRFCVVRFQVRCIRVWIQILACIIIVWIQIWPWYPGTPGSSWVTPAPLKFSSRQEFADWLLGPKRASPGLIGEDNVRFLKKASFLRLSRLSRDGVFLSSFFVFFFTFIGVSLIRIGYSPLQIPRMKSIRPFLHYFTLHMWFFFTSHCLSQGVPKVFNK